MLILETDEIEDMLDDAERKILNVVKIEGPEFKKYSKMYCSKLSES